MTQENDELDNEERMFLIKDSLDRIARFAEWIDDEDAVNSVIEDVLEIKELLGME